MNEVRCAVLDDYQQAAHRMAEWSRLGPDVEVTFFRDPLGSIDAAADALAAFDVVVLMRERTAFPRELIERLPTLKLIVTTGHRNGALDIAAARKQGICVCGTGTLEPPTVELAWGLILSFARRLPEEVANLRAGGRWQQSLGIDLAGKQLGVLGLGRLGTRVARVARAFDMNVVAWSANLDDARCEAAGVQRAATLDALLAGSDIVTIHMVLSARTRGLIGTRELGLMKPGAFLVNTSRAPIVDEAALLAALERRQIAGAALDVY
ncbi:MAG: D-2-hydroxyacid dehydrogenase family protein, partial [Pseudomonas sp.]